MNSPVSTIIPVVQAGDDQLNAATIQELPIDGQETKAIDPADQNAFILIIAPLLLLFIGAVFYLSTRGGKGGSGGKAGLVMMLVGAFLSSLMLIYIVIAG